MVKINTKDPKTVLLDTDDIVLLDSENIVGGNPDVSRISFGDLKDNLPKTVKTSNVIRVEPTLTEDIEGDIYATYAGALAYILEQTPTENNAWLIELPAGNFEEDIEFNQYVNIRGNNTRLTGVLTSTFKFTGEISDILRNTTYIENCIILNMESEGSMMPLLDVSIFPFNKCIIDLDSGTSSNLNLAIMEAVDCQIKSGDFSITLVQTIGGMILGGIFGDTLGGDAILLTCYNTLVIVNDNVYTTIRGGKFKNCPISTGSGDSVTFNSGTYALDNCDLYKINFVSESTSTIDANNCNFAKCDFSINTESVVELRQSNLDEDCTINIVDITASLLTYGCTGLVDDLGADIVTGQTSRWTNSLDYGSFNSDDLNLYSGIVTPPTYTLDGNVLTIFADGEYIAMRGNQIERVVPYSPDPYIFDCSVLYENVIYYLFICPNGTYDVLGFFNASTDPFWQYGRCYIFSIIYDGKTTRVHLFGQYWGQATSFSEFERLKSNILEDGYKILKKNQSFVITETEDRHINISGGYLALGTDVIMKTAFNSSIWGTGGIIKFHFPDPVSGVWTFSYLAIYDNSKYCNGSDLLDVSDGNYVVNWLYIDVHDSNICHIVLGEGDYTYNQAMKSQLPVNLPDELKNSNNVLLLGRIIVKKNDSSATIIEQINDSKYFFPFSEVNHNKLDNVEGDGTIHLSVEQQGYVNSIPTIARVSELIPIEIFDDGVIPPDVLATIENTIRYRDFAITNNVITAYPKPREYKPSSGLFVGLRLLVTDDGGISTGDIIEFKFKFKKIREAYVSTTLTWQADTNYNQYDTISLTPIQVVVYPEDDIFDLNVLEIERVDSGEAGEYANKIGVLYLEFVWSKI